MSNYHSINPGAQPEPARVVAAVVAQDSRRTSATWSDYLSLTKPEITFLVTLSALAGFVLASPKTINGWTLFWALVGIPLVSAGGAALNHLVERDFDAQMKRTANRPLPAGRIAPSRVLLIATLLITAGLFILCPLTNPLTGVLAGLSVVLYVWVYTPLKRTTPYNTLIGALPGALPALGGWTAATGGFGAGGWAIFSLLLFWQMPHFMALAWMYKKDYSRAGYQMWTVGDDSGTRTVWIMIGFSVLMYASSLLPYVLGLSGLVYVAGAVVLAVWFSVPIYRFYLSRSVLDARKVLKTTVMYIPLLLILLVADRFLSS